MKTENRILMKQAREALSGKWGLAIGTFVLYYIITIGIQPIPFLGIFSSLFISGPLLFGICKFSLSISRNKEANVSQLFEGFNQFGNTLATYLLMTLFIILWLLLLVVPGIIVAISYSQTFFLLTDNPSMAPMEALNRSKELMNGYKMKFFLLNLRFIGLAMLCILTLGIGFLWLVPYIHVTLAKFHDDLNYSAELNIDQAIPNILDA